MPDSSVLGSGFDLTIKLILLINLLGSGMFGMFEDADEGGSWGAVNWVPREPDTVLDTALRPESMKRLGAGELSLLLGLLSGWKVDDVGRCGEEGDDRLSMFEDADFMSLLGLNSGVVACGEGVLPRPDEGARPEDEGLEGVIRDTNPAMSDLLALGRR